MADMQELIARLEAGPVYLTHKEAYDLAVFFGSDTALGLASLIRKAFAGGSLDAALALLGRALPDWDWQITKGADEMAIACIQHSRRVSGPEVCAPTPALALCIAILKAKAQGEGG